VTRFEQRLKQFPPFLVRLAARKKGRPKTRREIIIDSGLPGRTIDRLSRARTWDHVTCRVMFAFSNGCGVDLARLRQDRDYIKRRARAQWAAMRDRL